MAKKYFIISLDFDGVLAQGYEVKKRYAREWFGLDLASHQTKKEEFEALMKQLGKNISYRDLMDPLNEKHIMEYSIPDGCIEVLTRLYAQDCRFVVNTSRNDHDYTYALKFIGARFQGLIQYVHNTRNKSKAALVRRLHARIHVDDDLDKLFELKQCSLELIYFRQPENRHMPAYDMLEADSFYDLEKLINIMRQRPTQIFK